MNKLPILGIVAASSNAGKTTLITKLIPALAKANIRVSVIKHAHHQFDIDHPGKDSYQIREAGAVQTLVASSKRWALMTETSRTANRETEPDLNALIEQLEDEYTDLVLIEGFKNADYPKLEVHRPSLKLPLLANDDERIIAIACDAPVASTKPQLALNDTQAICAFIIQWIQQHHDQTNTL